MNLDINNHNFIIVRHEGTITDGFVSTLTWYACTKCNIETSFQSHDENKFSYYRSKNDMIGDESLNNLSCEEVIIKNIIE